MADIKIYGTLKNVTNEPIANAEQIGNLATVATSGSYNDLDDKPTIPTKTSDLDNDSRFVNDETIEPLTEQFSTYKSVYETLYDYDNFIKGPLALTGEWERTDYPSNGTYAFKTYNKTFGIRIDNKVENAGYIYFNTYHNNYQGSTPVQLMVEGDVVYSYFLRNKSSSQLGLYITNNNGTLTITINHYSESGGTITIPPGEITVIFPEDANIRYTSLLISSNYSISYLVSEGITKQLNLVAFSGSYNDLNDTPAPPTLPTKLSELTDDVKVYLSISSWVKVQGESVYTSSEYAADWRNKLYISSDESFDNWNIYVRIDDDNRLKAITRTDYTNYNRITGYAPYAGTLVIAVKSDSQNSFSTHKWYISNGSNNVNGAKQYSVNIGVGSFQKYIFYVEKGEFRIMTDAALSPSSTIVFDTIALIPTLAGLEREVSQYSPGYMSAADKTKLDGIATRATANIGTVTGVTINNTTKTPTNGTVDLGTVLTSTTSSATNGSTTPITSGGVYKALQSYLTTSSANSTYEKKMSFTSVSSLPSTCVINTYYRITSNITSLAVTLPSSSLKAGDTIGISFTAGSSITTPTVSGGTIYKQYGWSNFFEANATYEIVALYDGGKWLVTSTKFNS